MSKKSSSPEPTVNAKAKPCKAMVKDDTGKASECATMAYGECPNRRAHVQKLKTGFCAIGACEGERKLGATGAVLKPCADWRHCPCECHKKIDSLFSMMGMRREYKDMSGYVPPENTFKMPSLEERAAWMAAQKAGVQDVKEIIRESPLPDVIPATIVREFNPTPTGRAARGELEAWVREICDEFLVEKYGEFCTPALVAEMVGKAKGINPPSSGAVDAVFKRWEAIGFAEIARKPTRFIAYTADGAKHGLEALKLRARDAAKSRGPVVRLR